MPDRKKNIVNLVANKIVFACFNKTGSKQVNKIQTENLYIVLF
jgi:hypothetical protein